VRGAGTLCGWGRVVAVSPASKQRQAEEAAKWGGMLG